MKITKYGHSCVLVETEDRIALFDPGVWSEIDIKSLPGVDRLIITHKHGDHMDTEVIKQLLEASPELHIVANNQVSGELKQTGISAKYRGEETACTKPFKAPHEALPMSGAEIPDNTGFHFQGGFSHPGDSHSFSETKRVLALPVIAPWGSTVDAVNLALKLQPEHVIPIHDWHYSDEARTWLYSMLGNIFDADGIKFHPLTTGDSVDI